MQIHKSKRKKKSAVGETLTIVRTTFHLRKGMELLLVGTVPQPVFTGFTSGLPLQVKKGRLVCGYFAGQRGLSHRHHRTTTSQSASSQTQEMRWITDVGFAGSHWKFGKVTKAAAVNSEGGLGPSSERQGHCGSSWAALLRAKGFTFCACY